MLGRPGESARVGQRGLEVVRRYGIDSTVLVANFIEALLAIGNWDEADNVSTAALRAITANFPYMLLMIRADLELGRGNFDAARAHLEAALVTLREDRGQGVYDVFLAELALWEHRWLDADQATREPGDGARPSGRPAPHLVLRQGAAGPGGARRSGARPPRHRRAPELARSERPSHRVARRDGRDASATHPTPPAGSPWPKPSTNGRAACHVPSCGQTPQRLGIGSNARPSRPTAVGAKPRPSSPPAHRAPTRACPSPTRTPPPFVSEQGRSLTSSSCSPNAPGLISLLRRPDQTTAHRAWSRCSA